jgi:hypothetical protein
LKTGNASANLARPNKNDPPRGITMRHLTMLLTLAAGILTACARDPVERELVGSWQTAISSPAGAFQLRFTTLSNGQYHTDFLGPFPVPAETGYFAARGGEWRIEKTTGGIDEGTYEFLTDDSVLFRSATGAVVWSRLSTTASSALSTTTTARFGPGSPPGSELAPAARASAALTSAQPNAAPSADLLATGPFGSALLQTPEATQGAPASATSSATADFGTASATSPPTAAFGTVPTTLPFGAPAPGAAATLPDATSATALQQPQTSGGAGGTVATFPSATFPSATLPATPQPATQTIGGAVGGVQAQLEENVRALGDAPEQALEDLQGSAEQAAAGVIDQAAAPVTEAADEASRKVGERLQTFGSNAGSKLKNFFTRGKRSDNEEAPADKEP